MKNSICMAAACIVLAGCESTPIDPRTRECLIEKDVNVRVMDDKYIIVDRDPIVVCKKNQHIRWVLAGPYQFTDEGVTVDDRGDNEFSNCKLGGIKGDRQPDGLAFKCHDKNDKQGQGNPRSYKYTITVRKSDGTLLQVDPLLMND